MVRSAATTALAAEGAIYVYLSIYLSGMMGTHDMETYKYFKDKGNYNQNNNKVLCALTPRELDTKELTDTLQNQFGSAMYTHHQKSVIIDTECGYQPDGRRKLVAYVGGLDLTGRKLRAEETSLDTIGRKLGVEETSLDITGRKLGAEETGLDITGRKLGVEETGLDITGRKLRAEETGLDIIGRKLGAEESSLRHYR